MNALIQDNNKLLMSWLENIPDPEIPVVSIVDLGILRHAEVLKIGDKGNIESVKITITPTYTGCPAMDLIAMQIRMMLLGRGIKDIEIVNQLTPAWTSDWISASGIQKMEDYGIVPPKRKSSDSLDLFENDKLTCPKCHSNDTKLISSFGSTACKALYQCNACHEPFEHFKCH